MVKVFQLSVEVGRCWLPENAKAAPLQYVLSVELTRDLVAATSIKDAEQGVISFGTRLFVRLDKLPGDKIPTCLIVLTGIDNKGNRLKLAFTELLAKSEGLQQFKLKGARTEDGQYRVELQFGSGLVQAKETRAKNNKSNSFKGSLSKKQSSCEQTSSKMKKKGSNFQSMGELDMSTFKESAEFFGQTVKVSKHDESNNISKEELQTSVATSKPQTKVDNSCQHDQTATMLAWQIKVDQLEEQLTIVSKKLNQCNFQLESTLNQLENQKSKNKRIELEKEELKELLILEETRAKMAEGYMIKINRLLDSMNREDRDIFQQIQEKDQIIMLNEELQNEVNSKRLLIDGLKAEIITLKDKIVDFEAKMTPNISAEPKSSIRRINQLPGKQLREVKSEKRLIDRKTSTWNKKQEDKTKETNSSKQNPVKKQRETIRAPAKKDKEVKAPVKSKIPSHRVEIPPARIPKAGKTNKLVKSQSNKLEPEKKSNIDSSLQILTQQLDSLRDPTNLMLNSRALQQETARVETH